MKLAVVSCVVGLLAFVQGLQSGVEGSSEVWGPEFSSPGETDGGRTGALGGRAQRSVVLSLSRSLDRGLVVRTPQGFLLSGRNYRADVGARGLRFVPTVLPGERRRPLAGGQLELSLSALAGAEGERELLPSGPATQPGGLFGTAVVTPYAADGLLQTLQAHPDGVELGVWLSRRPQQEGGVRLVFALEASLERLLVERRAGEEQELALGGRGVVRIGRAQAIDAAGRRSELAQRVAGGRLEIELDAGLLSTAAYPLWIDPKIGSALPISGSPSSRDVDPDVVFDPLGGEFVVVWERAVSGGESDVWGARVDPAGSVVAGPFPVDVTASALATRPRIALEPLTGNYLVVYEDELSGGPGRTVRWSLFDASDVLIATQSFTVSGYLEDVRPDVGYVEGPPGSSGFVLVHRRSALSAPDSTVEVSWIDAGTGALVDSQTVAPLAPARDSLPAVAQLSQGGESLLAFQRFDTLTSELEVLSSCVLLGGGALTLGAALNVSTDATGPDGAPDVSVVEGTYQVVWEHLIPSTSNRNIRGREVLGGCGGLGGASIGVTTLTLLEASPAVVAGRYGGSCDGQSLVLFTTSVPPVGSSPQSVATRRWASGGGLLGLLESVAVGQAGVSSYSTPRAALDGSATTLPRWLVVYDDDGTGTNAAAEVLGQLVTFDEIPLSAGVAPAAAAVCAGGSVTFTAGVTGSGAFTYQWRQDGVAIGGATSSAYTIGSASTSSAGTYDVVVSGVCGTLLSEPATLSVSEPITGVTIAASASPACAGTDVVLTASTAAGVPTAWGWFKDGVFLKTTTLPTLTLTNVQPSQAGNYTVITSNVCGSAASPIPALLEVVVPLTGVTISGPAARCAGQPVTFDATVQGGAGSTIGYQWYRDGAPIAGATGASYLIAAVQPGDGGSYTVEASNFCGAVVSGGLAFQVAEPITGVTISASSNPACAGTDVVLTASTATGIPAACGWFKDGVLLQTTSAPTLTLSSVQLTTAGSYTVTAGNACGYASSSIPLLLQVVEPLTGVALSGPSSQCAGQAVTFEATAQGGAGGAIGYQWYRDGTPLAGATGSSYSIAAVQPGDAGTYTVEASNTCGMVVSSGLSFQIDELITGVALAVDANPACAGTSVTFTATLSSGLGAILYEWFRDGVSLGPPGSSNFLQIASVQPSDAGDYQVEASNACGALTSQTLSLEVFSAPILYCTAKPNSLGCSSVLSWTGFPSASAGSGFEISYGPIRGNAFGLFIYTTLGPAKTPIQNSFGTLCLSPALIRRTPAATSGGTSGTCSGSIRIDFNAFFASPAAPPVLQPGSTVDMQCWYRDPPNPGGANLSNAIGFVMCPL